MEYPNATTRYKFTLDSGAKEMSLEYPGRTEVDIEADDRATSTFIVAIRAEELEKSPKQGLYSLARSLVFSIDRFVGSAQTIYWRERPHIFYNPESQHWVARARLDAE